MFQALLALNRVIGGAAICCHRWDSACKAQVRAVPRNGLFRLRQPLDLPPVAFAGASRTGVALGDRLIRLLFSSR